MMKLIVRTESGKRVEYDAPPSAIRTAYNIFREFADPEMYDISGNDCDYIYILLKNRSEGNEI